MVAVALALFSSLSFRVADFLGGLASRRLPLLTVLLVSQTVGLAGIAVVVAARAEAAPGRSFVPLALLAAVFGTIAIAALYRGLAVGAMSVVAPIAATAAVVPVVFGALTGENRRRSSTRGSRSRSAASSLSRLAEHARAPNDPRSVRRGATR